MTKDHGFESQLPLSGIFRARNDKELCFIHTFNSKASRVRRRVKIYNIIF